MIERLNPVTPRLRAGSQPQRCPETSRSWMQERAPRLHTAARERQRRERIWAWLSLVVLIVCWDVSTRLEEHASVPRLRIAHALAEEEMLRPADVAGATIDL
jgi:hypothetical protein